MMRVAAKSTAPLNLLDYIDFIVPRKCTYLHSDELYTLKFEQYTRAAYRLNFNDVDYIYFVCVPYIYNTAA